MPALTTALRLSGKMPGCDWEINTVIGTSHQGVLVTVVDRVSKFNLIKKVGSKHAEVVMEATITLLKP